MKAKNDLFPFGEIWYSPAADAAMREADQSPATYFDRHGAGDWGEVSARLRASNDKAVVEGGTILSLYTLPTGVRVWVTTRADRSATGMMLTADMACLTELEREQRPSEF